MAATSVLSDLVPVVTNMLLKGLGLFLLLIMLVFALQFTVERFLTRRKQRNQKRIPPWLRRVVWRRGGECCAICNSREDLECYHIIPFLKGGETTEENLQILCSRCNKQKGAHI